MKVEMRDPADLIPYHGNARVHPEDQIEQLKSSIAEFGFVNPILIGDDDVLIAGHGRLIAALALGLPEVPTITLSHLSDVQRRALILADNRIAANAGWNEAALARELAALQEEGFDLDVVAFDEAEVEDLLNGLEDGFFDHGAFASAPPEGLGVPDGDEPPAAYLDEDEEAGADRPAPGFHWVLVYVDEDGIVHPTALAGDPPKIVPVRSAAEHGD
ncbi:ParB-like nuclease domain [Rhodobacter phage RcKvothe]|nr:ParB-like nuclease domain protein [Rhodobacter phage RcDormio]QXN71198.1 ParB-like nuclease domain protein [Rhodobacter phage RcFrancesLouise]QXN71870.1 ParB-like nuclease domain protein [Rhodobacter phage RcOceanus]UUV43878.1 ParB-like nuclease domain [Rhodobacter phage RcKvothe]UUV44140.1 ParB-like nuclease domain [Rhodobacter phage RcMamaDuck]